MQGTSLGSILVPSSSAAIERSVYLALRAVSFRWCNLFDLDWLTSPSSHLGIHGSHDDTGQKLLFGPSTPLPARNV